MKRRSHIALQAIHLDVETTLRTFYINDLEEANDEEN